MTPRFYLANLDAPALTGAEAHHARHVLRIQIGAKVVVFDGHGNQARCAVTQVSDRAVALQALDRSSTPPLPSRITLASAVTKKAMDLLAQKATELGVAAIVPLVTDRTIVRTAKPDRWREIAIEACKQSGNNWLPEIHAPVALAEFLKTAGTFDLKLIAALVPGTVPFKSTFNPTGRSGLPPAIPSDSPAGRAQKGAPTDALKVLVLIGPEGDFTPAEIEQATTAGCVPVSLGSLTLRAETAALYALSVLHHELQVG
jgi:16S rRNA (uracil1498-N3)-methyltransferase